MRLEFKQNNFTNLPGVEKDGCLFMSLIQVVAFKLNYKYTRQQIERIYWMCSEKGYLGSEASKAADGAFVWNHEGILRTASVVADRSDVSWQYLARIYMPQEIQKGRGDYVADPHYWEHSDIFILQVQTDFGGHFRLCDYEPWAGGTNERYLKSIRYYRMVA